MAAMPEGPKGQNGITAEETGTLVDAGWQAAFGKGCIHEDAASHGKERALNPILCTFSCALAKQSLTRNEGPAYRAQVMDNYRRSCIFASMR